MVITTQYLQSLGFKMSDLGDYLVKEFSDGAEVRVYEGDKFTIEVINGNEMSRVETTSFERLRTVCSIHHIRL